MNDSIEKFGERYLNISHLREISFEDATDGEIVVANVVWHDGSFERFRGETAKALHSFFDPKTDNGPGDVRKIVLTLLLNPDENKWFVGATDGTKAVRSQALVETDDLIFYTVQLLKPLVNQDEES